jgi:hypothetical protein
VLALACAFAPGGPKCCASHSDRKAYPNMRAARRRRIMTDPTDKLARLLNSALFVDAVCFPGFRREQDLTPEERERGERWRQWASQRRPVTSYSRRGK